MCWLHMQAVLSTRLSLSLLMNSCFLGQCGVRSLYFPRAQHTGLLRLSPHAPLSIRLTTQGVGGEEGNGEAGGEEGNGEAASLAPLPEAVRCLAAAWRCASATTASAHGAALADTLALALNPGTCLGSWGACSMLVSGCWLVSVQLDCA